MMNPFEQLEIPNNSSVDVAKKAFRKLAMIHHPDRGGDSEKFKLIKAAWELIESGKYVTEIIKNVTSNPVPGKPSNRWSKPEDIGWMSHRAASAPPSRFKKPTKPNIPWRFNFDPSHVEFAISDNLNEGKDLNNIWQFSDSKKLKETPFLGEFTINATLSLAFKGFSTTIQVGKQSHVISFAQGSPHQLKNKVELTEGHVIINLELYDKELIFKSSTSTPPEKTIITSGNITTVIRLSELEINVCIPKEQKFIEVEECGGEILKILIPDNHDRAKPLFAKGFGYYDWFPEFKKAGSVRGNLKINFKNE